MNRKIFTLLASALMLFSTAFNANARSVAEKAIGADVKTLVKGQSPGMYHIRIDSICVANGMPGLSNGRPAGSTNSWVPVTNDGLGSITPFGIIYDASGEKLEGYELKAATVADTMVLSISESGQVIMISIGDLKKKLARNDKVMAKMIDLQATMWCVDVEDDPEKGQWPTYHYTNKIFNQDLDYYNPGTTVVGGSDKGWMFSEAYTNNRLATARPFYRLEDYKTEDYDGYYRVIVAETDKNGDYTGRLETQRVPIDEFLADTVRHMLKFSIVKVSPFVLTAEDFNTKLGNAKEGNVKLKFGKSVSETNYFGKWLFAEDSKNLAADALGYLNVRAYEDKEGTDFLGYLANSNRSKFEENPKYPKYNNEHGDEFLNIHAIKNPATDMENDAIDYDSSIDQAGDFNYSYRFVYFPSEDSLVINAYHVHHEAHSTYGTGGYTDTHPWTHTPGAYNEYQLDGPNAYYYYGLYCRNLFDQLIVRYQDLNNSKTISMMTIGQHPSNIHLSFGVGCEESVIDAWLVPDGVYTIWDDRGRCLGVRIYNGTYSPQWMELFDGECPDRIPSYQWVIERSENSNSRVNIYSREFGNLAKESESLVAMKNVRVTRAKSQIFGGQGQFVYSPIVQAYDPEMGYEPITKGWVVGQLLDAVGPTDCAIKDNSGFRPVTNDYVVDEFLGYKHFHVDQNPSSVSYGKSEDIGKSKGMDYNAYAFNYLHNYGEDGYIDLKANHGDSILHINEKTGFQFMLGTNLRAQQYAEELFGYPRTAWSERVITDGDYSYTQDSVPVLKRYYYELKIADFYDYRNGLAEQFVVLKGAKEDNSDRRNMLKYGVANVWADKDPFKFANVYLRETYFLKRDKTINEERKPQDDSRRIFYALLDRIEAEQLEKVTSVDNFEVSDTLMNDDGTTKYNLVTFKVDDYTLWVQAQGKTVSNARTSTFALENMNYPLYRRLRSMRDDSASEEGDGIDASAPCQLDAPKTLRIYREYNPADYLHEDAISQNSYNTDGINYLGVSNITQYKEELAPDGMVKYNYNLFIDTAFINRGTGWIKPQYLIAVGQKVVKARTQLVYNNCDEIEERELMPYVEGRYLINATDSSQMVGSNGKGQDRDVRYKMGTDDRLVFVPAIHVDDRLYIVSRLEDLGVTRADYVVTDPETDEEFIDGAALRALTETGILKGTERRPENSAMYGAYYDFGTWDNYHNDVCFSLRFRQPYVENPNAEGIDEIYSNYDKRFFIESETTNRNPYGNRKIAPVQGGWIRIHNDVPVLSRGSYEDAIGQGDIFNVEVANEWQNGEATANDPVSGKVTVVGGNGTVIISNAAGKQVTLSNILGQTIVTKTLATNMETINASKGIVVVTVEGESAVKTIVK